MSFLALISAVIALIITFLRIDVTMSHDAFVGIMASFVGAATIIVGAQIYNSIEAKRLMNDVTIDSMYGAPYTGTVASEEKNAQIFVKRDDQDYARQYNPQRVNKEKED